MKRKELKSLPDIEMLEYFAWVSSRCIPDKLVNIHLEENDKKNIDKIVKYRDFVDEYLKCIKELKRRGFTLQEIMEVR